MKNKQNEILARKAMIKALNLTVKGKIEAAKKQLNIARKELNKAE
jgi:cellobiose-specific phosphotransferase system component IIA